MSNAPSNVSSLQPQVDYGSSWSCVDDLTMPSVLVKGNRVVAEAVARRLITRRGQLVDDPNYGFALTDYLEADLPPAELARIRAGVQAECVKDERVSGATATVTLAGAVLVVVIVLTVATGPFTLVLSVSDVNATILQVSP